MGPSTATFEENFFRRSFDLLPDGVALIDATGKIQLANLALVSQLGLGDRDHLVGNDIQDLLTESYRDHFTALVEFALLSEQSLGAVEMNFRNQAGACYTAQVYISPWFVAGQKWVHLVVRNITEWKQVQDELISTYLELENAHWATLEGWARALELRDYETKGHTQRVTEAAVNLAIKLGMGVEQAFHIRQGALLHDIGKVAIPDSILLKPGPLNTEEWALMKQHPVYAYQLLQSIDFVQPALCIPYSHHERWDGGGYPQGLKKEQIPLPARLFAVIDVWDALLSDRPYRKGWSEDHVLTYLLENAGTQFDPEFAKIFVDSQ